MSESVVFDQAAEIYDATRTLLPETLAEIVKALAAELSGRGQCLEIGVGTGRIALPLAEAGIPMAGVDLSAAMLAKLRAKKADFPAVLADATDLPFAADSFGAGLAVHVLHLVGNWRVAVAELARVVRPGGVILVDIGGGFGFLREIDEHFTAAAGIERARPGVTDPAELDEEMARLEAGIRELSPIIERQKVALTSWIQALEANVFSSTWSLDEKTRLRVAAQTREWAAGRFGDLDQPRPLELEIRYRAYELL